MMDPWYTPDMLFPFALPIMGAVLVWILAIKGYALWHAARNEQKWWFVFLLIVNGFGIPEIVYLVWFRADKQSAKVAPAPAPAPSTAEKGV